MRGNARIRELTSLRQLVADSGELSETLKTRLHKVLDQSVSAADPDFKTLGEAVKDTLSKRQEPEKPRSED